MKLVRIKQLKVRLSEYVRLAKARRDGARHRTGRGRCGASPVASRAPIADRLEELLDALAAAGEISRAAQPERDWTWHSRGLGLPSGAAQALLDELRQERL